MDESIDLWQVESYLYAWIDAEGMRENSQIEKKFDLGNKHSVSVRINNFCKKPLSNPAVVKTNEFVFSLNFWKNGQKPWFRVDNESVGFLHFHKDNFNEHQKLEETYTLSELISFTFDWTYKILNEKFPDEPIKDSSGFVGCA
jgi:hypothetical protein